AAITGVKHAIAVVNGTAALHICLKYCGVQAADEVLIPAVTFVATANAVSYCGAVPHFIDSSMETLGVDPIKLGIYLDRILIKKGGYSFNKETGRRVKACIAVHTYGHPVDLDPLIDICKAHYIDLIEDAAESLGSYYKGRHTGGFGDVSSLSFNGNKIVTTGGGGAILTNDSEIASQIKHITTTAKLPHVWDFVHDEVGYNFRLPNINSALGCAQLEQLPGFIEKKRANALKYQEAFKDVDGIKVFCEPAFARSNYWLNVLLLDVGSIEVRNLILKKTNEAGIMTRPVWVLLNKLQMYKDCPKMDLTTASDIEARLINIPSSARLFEM
ncbi:MAG: LegC family aminotransferase, partial [Nitrospirae bacterium]|nr:LegC family aminotransferase [Nitrospirota bacterium]